jgi:hypothetical protein
MRASPRAAATGPICAAPPLPSGSSARTGSTGWRRRSGRGRPEADCRPAPSPTRGAAGPARRTSRLPAVPAAGARGLASWMEVASASGGRGGGHRRRADRSLARPLAGVVDRAARGAAHRLAAAVSSVSCCGQGLAAAGADAATQRRRAGDARAGRLPGAARRHPSGMAGQPRPSGGRVDRGLGDQVVATVLARGAPQSHRVEARPRHLGRHGSRAARGGGSRRRCPGRRHHAARSRPAVRPRMAVARGRLVGPTGPGGTPRRLADAIRGGPRVRRGEVDQAAARALEVLRPAA